MITHRGFSAWITSAGGEVFEYEAVVDSKANKVSCWIPCQEGKNFVVHWRDNGSGVDTATYLKLDGFTVAGRFLYGVGEAERSAVRVGDSSERPFVFSKVQAGTTGTPDRVSSRTKDAGTIVVKIRRIKRKEARAPNAPQKPPSPVSGRHMAGQLSIGFGQERPTYTQTPSTWAIEPHKANERGPYVTFVFRYRSRDFLVSQGIMSRNDPEYRATPPHVQQTTPPQTPALSTASAPVTPSPSPSPRRFPPAIPSRVSASIGSPFPGHINTIPEHLARKRSNEHEHQ
ncbi:hypothetical protein AcW1_005658 [Taiwanofungus camphoratus]|nr:hypothetical protein AcW2_004422 [Antrodia cinnamomea]KAI0933139.1 hypothetical protein AcV7_004698 [Antrodia cinnamomea]KAI0933993.1 hypothetical protein AcV5_005984 [Antrodia cinnamomea]KAI0957186.1 hypothetical protein AcW1_005658 [Antrodia cinnamomea]